MAKILCVEDDEFVANMYREYLQKEGHDFFHAQTNQEFSNILDQKKVDIILLDVMLNGESGIDLLKNVREHSDIPVIIISDLGDDVDRVIGLEHGADDYMRKPVLPKELSLRIKALLRRYESKNDALEALTKGVERFRDFYFDRDQFQAFNNDGTSMDLTALQYEILNIFITNKGKTLVKERLFEMVYKTDTSRYDRALDLQISRIRKKIEINPRVPKYIQTVRGVGYKFVPDEPYED